MGAVLVGMLAASGGILRASSLPSRPELDYAIYSSSLARVLVPFEITGLIFGGDDPAERDLTAIESRDTRKNSMKIFVPMKVFVPIKNFYDNFFSRKVFVFYENCLRRISN